METNAPSGIVLKFLGEVEKLKVPTNFVKGITYIDSHPCLRESWSYPVFGDGNGSILSAKRGFTDEERERYRKLIGVDTELNEGSVFAQAKRVQQIFKTQSVDPSAYQEIEVSLYNMRRNAEEKLKSLFRRNRHSG